MSVGDFGALPPEINSARMYAGAGAEPMMAAASAWDSVAAELSSAAESYQATVNELTDGSWLGSSSQSMAAAAAPFVAWMNTTATKAEVTAGQARSAAAAYEEAFAATVPPPVIEANRTLLAALIATNTLGQNATAIAATESQYAEMWAQDAEAMYGYAASSASASQVPMFTSAQQNTSDSGTTDQAAATTAATSSSTGSTSASVANNILDDISNALTNFASGNGPVSGWLLNTLNGPLISGFNDLTTITSGDSYFLSGTTFLASGVGFIISPMINAAEGPLVAAASAAPAVEAPAAAAAGLASSTEPQVPGATASAGGAASAALGEAKSIGSLSTPPSWGGSSPAIRLASTAVPMATLDTLPAARLGGNGFFGGLPPVASVVNAPRGGGAQPGSERSRQRARAGASDHDEAPGMPGQPRHVSVAKNTEADANRDELNTLRKALADLTRERDILKRTASFMIQEARK